MPPREPESWERLPAVQRLARLLRAHPEAEPHVLAAVEEVRRCLRHQDTIDRLLASAGTPNGGAGPQSGPGSRKNEDEAHQ